MALPADLVEHAIGRLPSHRRGPAGAPTNTEKKMRALLSPVPALMQAMLDMLTKRGIDHAVGAQLDIIGGRVGRAREGVTDDEIYRRYIRAQITANRSNGRISDVYKIADLVINDPAAVLVFRNEGAAAYVLEVGGIALPDAVAAVLIELLIRATGGGVRAAIQYAASTPATTYRLDSGPGYDVGHYATSVDREI